MIHIYWNVIESQIFDHIAKKVTLLLIKDMGDWEWD